MGNTAWIDELYTSEKNMFGEELVTRGPLPAAELARIYCQQLKQLFENVSTPVIMRNCTELPPICAGAS